MKLNFVGLSDDWEDVIKAIALKDLGVHRFRNSRTGEYDATEMVEVQRASLEIALKNAYIAGLKSALKTFAK